MATPECMVLGVDPGLDGALALFSPDRDVLDVRDMPVLTLPKAGGKHRREIDLYGLANLIDGWSHHKIVAWVEQVSASPQMGTVSAFSFGGSYWAVRAALAANFIRTELVPPGKWKRELKVPALKDGARARASVLMPKHSHYWQRGKDDGRAESALIAMYGAGQ